jgi:hypothetical protein
MIVFTENAMNIATTSTHAQTTTRSLPGLLLRLEGLAVLAAALVLYADQGWSALALIALLLAPDLAALGYLVNPQIGALAYNMVHTYALPLALLVFALLADVSTGTQVAAIWFAHIGMDRMLGFGLKYPTNFSDTHLQRV